MSSFNWPISGGRVATYATLSAFPSAASAGNGSLAIALDTDTLYISTGSIWQAIGGASAALSVGALDGQAANAQGLTLTGNTLYQQSADATHPGLVNNTTQSFSGNKTFTGTIGASNLSGTNTGDVSLAAFGSSPNANGASLSGQVLNLQPADATHSGGLSSADWNTFNSKLASTDGAYSLVNTIDNTKAQKWDLSGQSASTTLTISPVNTSNMVLNIPQVATASGAGMALVQDETTGFIFSYGIASSIGGANSMMQLANASTANRAQIKLHSYFNGASVAGVSTLTSQSGTIAVNAAITAGNDYSKWTAQAAATTPGSAPISGTWAFKANTVNSLTVTSDFHLQLTNLAGTLADRLYLSSEGALKLSNYSTGLAHFDSSGNITSSSVALADMSSLAANSIIGNNTGSPATPLALTATQVTAMLNTFTSSLQGVVPSSGGGTTNFLRADGTWAAPAGAGTVTSVGLADSTNTFNITNTPVTGSGTLTLATYKSQTQNTFLAAPDGSSGAPTFRTIVAADVPTLNQNTTGSAGSVSGTNVITNSNLATMAAHTYKGNNTGSTATPIDVTSTQLTADLNLFTSSLQGLVPASGGGTTNFLRADGTFAAPAGGMTNPMTTTGDIIYASNTASPSTPARLGIGSTGQVLTVSGGLPSWATPAGGSSSSGVEALEQKNENEKYNIFTDPLDNSIGSGLIIPPASYQVEGILFASNSTTSGAVVWGPPKYLNASDKNTTTTTNWTTEGQGGTLTTSGTTKIGATSISFNKTSGGTTAGIKYDSGSANQSWNGYTRIWFWIFLPTLSTGTYSNVYVEFDIDATNNSTWNLTAPYTGSLTANAWNAMFVDVYATAASSSGGTGWSGTTAPLFRYLHLGVTTSASTATASGILVNAFFGGLANSSNFIPLGTTLTISDATHSESIYQIDSSNTYVDGPITLTNSLTNTYAGGYGNSFVYRSTLTISAGQALLGPNDPNGNAYAGAVATTQDIRLSRYFRDALSSSTLGTSISVNTTQNYICFSTTTNQIVIVDSSDTHLNLLSGDVLHCFSTTYTDGVPNYIYLGDFTLTSNSSFSTPNTTLTGTGGVPAGVAAGSLIVKKQLKAAKFSAVSTGTTNESFSNLTALSSPDGILANTVNLPLPNPTDSLALYTLNGTNGANNAPGFGSFPSLTLNGALTTNIAFKNGQFATQGWSYATNYYKAVGTAANFGAITTGAVSAWFYYSTSGHQSFICGTYNGTNGLYFGTNVSNQFYVLIQGSGTAAGTLNVGGWNFGVAQWNANGTLDAWLNGVLVQTTALTTFTTANDFTIGSALQGSLAAASGDNIAQVTIWSGAKLSAAQILQLYNNGQAQVVGNPATSLLKYRYSDTGVSGSKVSVFAQLTTDTTAVEPWISQISLIKTG